MTDAELYGGGNAAPQVQTPAVISQQDSYDAIVAMLNERADRLRALLPPHVPYDMAVQLIQTALTENPDLLLCTKSSIWSACCAASTLGLQLNGPLQEAWLVAYNRRLKDDNGRWHTIKEAKFQTGYKGWIRLARNTGGVKEVVADVVYKEEVEKGLVEITRAPPDVRHRLDLTLDRDSLPEESVVGAYAFFSFTNGGQAAVWVPRTKLDLIEKLSKAGWRNTDKFPTRRRGMQRKTAILQAFHGREVPISENVAVALGHEKELDGLDVADAEVRDVPKPEAPQVTGPQEFTPHEKDTPAEPADVSLEEAQRQDAEERKEQPELF